MAGYLHLKSDRPGSTALVLLNGSTDTGYYKERGTSWGFLESQPILVDSIDTQGAHSVGHSIGKRTITIPVMVHGISSGALSQNVLTQRIEALANAVQDLADFKGRIRSRANSLTYCVEYQVEHASIPEQAWGRMAELGAFVQVPVTFVVKPYAYPDPMDIQDRYLTNTLTTGGLYNTGGADWTKLAGTNSVTISGGKATSGTTTGQVDYEHTGTPHLWGDVQVTHKVVFDTIAASKGTGVNCKVIDSNHSLMAWAGCDGAGAGTLLVYKEVGGTYTSLASAAITTLSASTNYWIRIRVEGHIVIAEWWNDEPAPSETPTHETTEYVLTQSEQLIFGQGVRGGVGFSFNTVGSGTFSFDHFKVEPYTYNQTSNNFLPEVLRLSGEVSGNASAEADISYSITGTQARWMCYAWMPRPEPFNMVTNDGAEDDANGWDTTTVATLLPNSATSYTRSSSNEHSGSHCFQMVNPATSDSGAKTTIYRRFKKGRTYIASCWVKSAGGDTTNVRLNFGVSAQVAVSPTIALSTTWQKLTATLTPTSDREFVYFAPLIRAATATTWQIDDCMVYEAGPLKDQYSSNTIDDPVFYARLGETSGNVTDVIGSRTGTVNGNPTYGRIGPIPGDSTTCIDFDGTGDYVAFSYDATLNPSTAFTVEAWFMRDTDTGVDENIVHSITATTGFCLDVTGAADAFRFRFSNGGGIQAVTSASTASTATWYHIVGTHDGTTGRLYVDGKLHGQAVAAFVANSTVGLGIAGSAAGATLMNGKVANVRVYSRALTADEITRRAQGAPPMHNKLGIHGRVGSESVGGQPPFGIIEAESYDQSHAAVSNVSITSDNASRGAFRVDATASPATIPIRVMPHLVYPDRPNGQYHVGVYARCYISNTTTALTATLGKYNQVSSTSYSFEYGSSGRSLAYAIPTGSPNFRPVFLGTISLHVDHDYPIVEYVTVTWSYTGTAPGIDYLVFVPSRRSASNITGIANSDYTYFDQGSTTTSKSIHHDLSGWVVQYGDAGRVANEQPDAGLLGSQIVFDPNREMEVLVWPSDMLVDRTDANSSSHAEDYTAEMRFAVRPRHLINRQN